MGQDGILDGILPPIVNRRLAGRWEPAEKRVANPLQVINLPHSLGHPKPTLCEKSWGSFRYRHFRTTNPDLRTQALLSKNGVMRVSDGCELCPRDFVGCLRGELSQCIIGEQL